MKYRLVFSATLNSVSVLFDRKYREVWSIFVYPLKEKKRKNDETFKEKSLNSVFFQNRTEKLELTELKLYSLQQQQ